MQPSENLTATNTQTSALARHWRLRSRSLGFERGPAIMGIVNVTPDSFSDGGSYLAPQTAVDHALRLEDAGADILDIGGESTRPYSQPVSHENELRRIVPVLELLAHRVSVPISIDTSKSSVAQAAIDLGAEIVNDVTGLEADPRMAELVARTGVGICAMHMRGTPQTMQDKPYYVDVVQEIFEYLRQRDEWLRTQEIAAERICLDPGIGFGKTHQHNLLLLQNAEKFLKLGRPILVGHSRKGFIGKLLGDNDCSRDAATAGISLAMAMKGIQVLRVHDVASTRDGLTGWMACGDGTDYHTTPN